MLKEQFIEILNNKKECLLDVVYRGSVSNSEDWMDNYALCNNYLKKYLYYRFNIQDNIDIDSSEYLMPIYVALCNNIFEDYTFIKEVKKYSQYEIAVTLKEEKKYSQKGIAVTPQKFYIRGDTAINAMSALKQIFEFIMKEKICKPSNNNCKNNVIRAQYKKCVEILESKDVYNRKTCAEGKSIFELLDTHIKLCYSYGNFYPLVHIYKRYALNSNKVHFYLNGYKSKFDDVMSEWLLEMKNCIQNLEIIRTNYRRNLEETYLFWINEYRKKDGWNNFIEDNCFNSFVENKDTPKRFWNITEDNFLLDYQNYLENVNSALEQRQNDIIQKVKHTTFERCDNLFEK